MFPHRKRGEGSAPKVLGGWGCKSRCYLRGRWGARPTAPQAATATLAESRQAIAWQTPGAKGGIEPPRTNFVGTPHQRGPLAKLPEP